MADPTQFTGPPYNVNGNPYPDVYDFENRNLTCAGTSLVFLDDCIAFCNPFGYEANHEVCGCAEGTQSCTATSHTSLMRALIPGVKPVQVDYENPGVQLNPGTCYVRYTCDFDQTQRPFALPNGPSTAK
jgi:hypothetical protein